MWVIKIISLMPLAKTYKKIIDNLPIRSRTSKVQNTIKEIIDSGNPKNNTKLVRYSNLKKYLQSINRKRWASLVKPPESLIDSVSEQNNDKLENRQNIHIDLGWVDKILEWENSGHYVHRIIFLQLTSGRRISEIIGSTFTRENKRTLSSTNLNKKRDKEEKCIFPLFKEITTGKWLASLKKVRRQTNDLKVNTITKQVNSLLKAEFDQPLTSHKLRGIYANVMYHRDGKKQIKIGFIKQILCLDSTDVAIHYSAYTIKSN